MNVSAPGAQTGTLISLYNSTTGQLRQVAAGPFGWNALFAPGERVSSNNYAVVTSMAESGGSSRTEASAEPPRGLSTHAWSAGGALAYIAAATPQFGQPSWLVIRPAAGAPVQVDLPPMNMGEAPPARLRFSPDGTGLLMVNGAIAQPAGGDRSPVQVGGLDGSLVFAGDASAADAAWGGDGRLYYSDARGVNVADLGAGTTRTLLSGIHWSSPDTSPEGCYVVFVLRNEQGVPSLKLLDTASGKIVAGFERNQASQARFVAPGEIWFNEEVSCSNCKGPTRVLLDRLMSYDVLRGAESPVGFGGQVTDVRQAG